MPSHPAKVQPSQPATGKSSTGRLTAAWMRPARRFSGAFHMPQHSQASSSRPSTTMRTFRTRWAPSLLLVKA